MKKLFVLLIMPWHLLSWSDFQGTPPKHTALSAMSNTMLVWEYDEDDSNKIYNIRVSADFNPVKSWTLTDDPYILKHEQGHLDICQIVCNIVTHYISREKKYSKKEWIELRGIYEDAWNGLDAQYDRETHHSENKQAQCEWDLWIAEQLKP